MLVEVDGHVAASGGFIIQLMPEADEAMISKLEERLGRVKSVTDMISAGLDAEGMIKDILGDIEYKVYEEKQVVYRCNCNKERLERALISVGRQELEDLIHEQGNAELVCHFCNSKYHFNKEELIVLLEKATT